MDQRIKRIVEALAEKVLPKRMRLDVKSDPLPTSYTDSALVSKLKLKRLKAIEKEASSKKQKLEKATKAQARAAVINQPELAHGAGFEVGAEVQAHEAPHASHDMRHVACAEAAVVYCNTCGKWSRRNAHSQLAAPCAGVCGWKGGLALLRNGIMRVQGARLPASARKRR